MIGTGSTFTLDWWEWNFSSCALWFWRNFCCSRCAQVKSRIRCKLRSENFINHLRIKVQRNLFCSAWKQQSRISQNAIERRNEINFHVKLNKNQVSVQGDLSLRMLISRVISNFGYQSSNICINTVIKVTWNLHQDVNTRSDRCPKLYVNSTFVTASQQNPSSLFLIKASQNQ